MNAQFEKVWNEMMAAGRAAAMKCPNDWYCGFAYVDIKGNTAFARWAKKEHKQEVHPGYPSGSSISVYRALDNTPHAMTQSMYVKEQAASAMAQVLNAYGIQARMTSRAD